VPDVAVHHAAAGDGQGRVQRLLGGAERVDNSSCTVHACSFFLDLLRACSRVAALPLRARDC
uniref:Uncharacterized protein n=1 Tax=Aegilops tauschii subsp. strangulata TaxID=200361 RepID=A0A453SCI0_AEGTS